MEDFLEECRPEARRRWNLTEGRAAGFTDPPPPSSALSHQP